MTRGTLTRREWLAIGLTTGMSSSQTLLVRREGDRLRVSAPQIRFLTGKPLEHLKNGASVAFHSLVTLTLESQQAIARLADRFVVSYDLWEEKFSATRLGPPRRSISRLSAPAAETWCLDHPLGIPAGLGARSPFWVRLELRAEDPRETTAVVGEPGINITRLIEMFSRPPRGQQLRWTAGAGPL
ncbi:MAG: hypothetical protein ACRD96_19450, partial [Bryobacteraceae bacterium]